MNSKPINFHGMKTKAVNYKGVQIIQNSLNGGWMLFYSNGQAPLGGTLSEMKGFVDRKLGEFIKEDTYN